MAPVLMKPALVFFIEGVRTVLPDTLVVFYVLLAFLCSILTTLTFVVSTMNKVYHSNLKRLYQAGILSWFLLIVSKILVIVTQQFFLFEDGPDASGLALLYTSAFFRYLYVFFFTATPLCVVIERAFATFYLVDYEQRSRHWIFWLIFLLNLAVGLSVSCLVVLQLVSILVFSIHVITYLSLALLFYASVFVYNSRKYRFLENHHRKTTYTLSIKYQLKENLVTLRSMRSLLLVILIAIFIVFLSFLVPTLLQMEVESTWKIHVFVDIIYHFNPLYTTPACLFFIPQNRELVAAKLGWSKSVNRVIYVNEGDVYFTMFQKSLAGTKFIT